MSRLVRGRAAGIAVLLAFIMPFLSGAAVARSPLIDEARGVMTLAPVLKEVTPAVVNIAVEGHRAVRDNPLMRDPFFRRFFDIPNRSQRPSRRKTLAAGSGVIVDAAKGYVLTNNHVAKHADVIRVTLKDGRTFKAKLIGSDPGTDIALLQIKARKLTQVPLGNSDKLQVGDFVLAIGNPFGLGQTVTSGIVSALGRSTVGAEKYEDFIQTDASINPGNSGGALVNSKGELMGINTAIIAPSGGNVGIGFAVPVNMARAVMRQILKYGKVHRGRIGITIQTVTRDIAEALGLGATRGAVISRVLKGAPAARAGLKAGDIITAINGRSVASSNDVRNRVGLLERGTRINLAIIRDGKARKVTVTIGAIPKAEAAAGSAIPQLSGATLGEIPADHPASGHVTGVLVETVERGSPAYLLGLRSGDIITAINRRKVSSLGDLQKVAKAANGSALALNIWRNGTELFIIVR